MSKYDLPDFTQDTATEYKTHIDQCVEGLVGSGAQFAAQETDPPSMGIMINQGTKPQSFGPNSVIHKLGDMIVPAATVTGLGAPGSGQIQLHVISFSWESFKYVRHYSAAVPDTTDHNDLAWPAVPPGNMQICGLILKGGMTQITDADIIDLRATFTSFPIHPTGVQGEIVIDDKNGKPRIVVKAFGDTVQFKNGAGAVVGYMDGNGDLYLKGTVKQIP